MGNVANFDVDEAETKIFVLFNSTLTVLVDSINPSTNVTTSISNYAVSTLPKNGFISGAYNPVLILHTGLNQS
jgi:hypothetical protein